MRFSGLEILFSFCKNFQKLVDRILEVERGVVRNYPGNYEKYTALRRERQETEARVHDKQLHVKLRRVKETFLGLYSKFRQIWTRDTGIVSLFCVSAQVPTAGV